MKPIWFYYELKVFGSFQNSFTGIVWKWTYKFFFVLVSGS